MADTKGFDQLEAILARAPRKARSALARAMYVQAGLIMKKSRDAYVPIDNEVLKTSGVVKDAIITANQILVICGYGGGASAYAEIQHENTALNHPPLNPRRTGTKKTSRPGRAKYLELAFMDYAPTIPSFLAEHCDKIFTKQGL